MEKSAEFSRDRIYRYNLWRIWKRAKGCVTFIGLNPSTADENIDDKTITRCIRFADRWGYGGMYMVNIFAFRATQPTDMMAHKFPIGELSDGTECNDFAIQHVAAQSKLVVATWGADGMHMNRGKAVADMFEPGTLMCFGKTKAGNQPLHPLYLPNNSKLQAV